MVKSTKRFVAMNVLWTILIGLGASIVGGIISGIFVMRKITHDNKRLYANQAFYLDFIGRYRATLRYVLQYLDFLGCETNEIKSLANMIDTDTKLVQNSLDGLNKWFLANTRSWVPRLNKSSIVQSTNNHINAIEDSIDFDDLSIKYPLQVSQFDRLYTVSSRVEALNGSMNLPASPSDDLINATIDNVIYIMLSVVEELNRVCSDLEYYRGARAWDWRLFIPRSRN